MRSQILSLGAFALSVVQANVYPECEKDNCYRQFIDPRFEEEAPAFCLGYLSGAIPTIAADFGNCAGDAAAVSSACSCITYTYHSTQTSAVPTSTPEAATTSSTWGYGQPETTPSTTWEVTTPSWTSTLTKSYVETSPSVVPTTSHEEETTSKEEKPSTTWGYETTSKEEKPTTTWGYETTSKEEKTTPTIVPTTSHEEKPTSSIFSETYVKPTFPLQNTTVIQPTILPSTTHEAPISSTQYTTSTVLATTVKTVYACPSSVTDCPAASKTVEVLTTLTVEAYTTICPYTAPPTTTMTSIVYSTAEHTIYACPSSVTNCPVESSTTYTTTSVIPVATTSYPAVASTVYSTSLFQDTSSMLTAVVPMYTTYYPVSAVNSEVVPTPSLPIAPVPGASESVTAIYPGGETSVAPIPAASATSYAQGLTTATVPAASPTQNSGGAATSTPAIQVGSDAQRSFEASFVALGVVAVAAVFM